MINHRNKFQYEWWSINRHHHTGHHYDQHDHHHHWNHQHHSGPGLALKCILGDWALWARLSTFNKNSWHNQPRKFNSSNIGRLFSQLTTKRVFFTTKRVGEPGYHHPGPGLALKCILRRRSHVSESGPSWLGALGGGTSHSLSLFLKLLNFVCLFVCFTRKYIDYPSPSRTQGILVQI